MEALTKALARLPFYYGWVVLGMTMLAGGMAAATSQAFMSVTLKPITDDTGWSRTAATTAISIGTVGAGLAAPFVGRMADRFGTRVLVSAGGCLLAVAFFLLSGMSALWQFYAGYVLARSIASPCLSGVGAQTTVVNWFSRRRGRAIGLVAMTMPLANAIQAPAGQWISSSLGWRAMFAILGGATAALVIVPGAVLLRRRPEDLGLHPDGAATPVDASTPARGRPVHAASQARDYDFTLRQAMGTRVLWLLVFGNFIALMGGGAISFHQVAYYTDIGLSPAFAAASVSVYTLAGAFSSGIWGLLAERYSERLLATVVMAIAAATMLAFAAVENEAGALLVSGSYGLAIRGEGTIFSLLLASYYGRGNFGSIVGFFASFSSFGLGLGPFVGALIFDFTGAYRVMFVTMAAGYLAIALVLVLLVRRPPLPATEAAEQTPAAG